jgi:hypothetical protein
MVLNQDPNREPQEPLLASRDGSRATERELDSDANKRASDLDFSNTTVRAPAAVPATPPTLSVAAEKPGDELAIGLQSQLAFDVSKDAGDASTSGRERGAPAGTLLSDLPQEAQAREAEIASAQPTDLRKQEQSQFESFSITRSGGKAIDATPTPLAAQPVAKGVADAAAAADSAAPSNRDADFIVYVDVKPESIRNREFEQRLVNHRIALDETAPAPRGRFDQDITNRMNKIGSDSRAGYNFYGGNFSGAAPADAILVDAPPQQIDSLLQELDADGDNIVRISIDNITPADRDKSAQLAGGVDWTKLKRTMAPESLRELSREEINQEDKKAEGTTASSGIEPAAANRRGRGGRGGARRGGGGRGAMPARAADESTKQGQLRGGRTASEMNPPSGGAAVVAGELESSGKVAKAEETMARGQAVGGGRAQADFGDARRGLTTNELGRATTQQPLGRATRITPAPQSAPTDGLAQQQQVDRYARQMPQDAGGFGARQMPQGEGAFGGGGGAQMQLGLGGQAGTPAGPAKEFGETDERYLFRAKDLTDRPAEAATQNRSDDFYAGAQGNRDSYLAAQRGEPSQTLRVLFVLRAAPESAPASAAPVPAATSPAASDKAK